MHLADKCCITELFDKPGIVQIDGLCVQCGNMISFCMSEYVLKKVLKQKNCEGTSINDQNKVFLLDGVCCDCQKETDTV